MDGAASGEKGAAMQQAVIDLILKGKRGSRKYDERAAIPSSCVWSRFAVTFVFGLVFAFDLAPSAKPVANRREPHSSSKICLK